MLRWESHGQLSEAQVYEWHWMTEWSHLFFSDLYVSRFFSYPFCQVSGIPTDIPFYSDWNPISRLDVAVAFEELLEHLDSPVRKKNSWHSSVLDVTFTRIQAYKILPWQIFRSYSLKVDKKSIEIFTCEGVRYAFKVHLSHPRRPVARLPQQSTENSWHPPKTTGKWGCSKEMQTTSCFFGSHDGINMNKLYNLKYLYSFPPCRK